MRAATTVEVELLVQIRGLALEMIRLERWAHEAAERNRWHRVAECHQQRDLACERRSELLRELWVSRREL